ncbi:MAG: cytochrome c biogenesis protein/redoxin [Elusimicrobiota bacterium]
MSQEISVLIAFLGGIASFFSPCILPLVPVYLTFITGLSINNLKDAKDPKKISGEIAFFILGFSFVFVALGASAGTIGSIIFRNQKLLKLLGGIVIILFAFHIIGLIKIKQLEYEKKLHLKNKPMNIFGSFIVGVVFAIGWTPCIGPILASILMVAATRETMLGGVVLLCCYSLGLSLPFIAIALAINKVLGLFDKIKKYFGVISVCSAIVLIAAGVLLIVESFQNGRKKTEYSEEKYTSHFEIESKCKPLKEPSDVQNKPSHPILKKWGNAPDFTLPMLNGKNLTLSDFAGKIIILDFWATWCPPCKAEIPFFVELQNEYKEKLVIVGVCLDRGDMDDVKKFIQKMQVNYPIVVGDRKIVEDYGGISGIPTTFIIDTNGDIKETIVGYRPKEIFENKIKTLLKL